MQMLNQTKQTIIIDVTVAAAPLSSVCSVPHTGVTGYCGELHVFDVFLWTHLDVFRQTACGSSDEQIYRVILHHHPDNSANNLWKLRDIRVWEAGARI